MLPPVDAALHAARLRLGSASRAGLKSAEGVSGSEAETETVIVSLKDPICSARLRWTSCAPTVTSLLKRLEPWKPCLQERTHPPAAPRTRNGRSRRWLTSCFA